MRYITAGTALNIPNDGRVADWHQYAAFSSHFTIAGVNYTGAERILGEEGIFNAESFLSDRRPGYSGPFLCATHSRAILDMLWNAVFVRGKEPRFRLYEYVLDKDDVEKIRNGLNKFLSVAEPWQRKLLDEWWEKEGRP